MPPKQPRARQGFAKLLVCDSTVFVGPCTCTCEEGSILRDRRVRPVKKSTNTRKHSQEVSVSELDLRAVLGCPYTLQHIITTRARELPLFHVCLFRAHGQLPGSPPSRYLQRGSPRCVMRCVMHSNSRRSSFPCTCAAPRACYTRSGQAQPGVARPTYKRGPSQPPVPRLAPTANAMPWEFTTIR